MEEIGWGIIGCGDVTEVKSGPAFQEANGSKLIAVMRRTANLAQDYAQRHQVPKWYADADDLINDPEVDAIYIATPPSSHKQYAIAASNAGKPVYVEKPMALNYGQCLEMIEICEKNRVPLFVAYYRRALPRFLRIRELLEKGMIGNVRFVNVTFYQKPSKGDISGKKHWRIDPEIAGAGYFYDLGSHILDVLQFFFGDIESVAGFSSNQLNLYNAEDIVSGTFRFSNSVHGAGIWNFNAYADLDRTEIIGEKGKITYATFGNSPIILDTGKKITRFDIKNPLHIQQPLIQTIVDELLGKGKCPSTGTTGAQTNRVMDRMV